MEQTCFLAGNRSNRSASAKEWRTAEAKENQVQDAHRFLTHLPFFVELEMENPKWVLKKHSRSHTAKLIN